MENLALEDRVEIVCSGEQGFIIGKASYSEGSAQALVRYKAADGRAVESWWNESALRKLG